MNLKPQDILVTLKLLDGGHANLTFAQLAGELGISASEANMAFHRARESGLISPLDRSANRSAVAELLIHGLKYLAPVHPGKRTRGVVTGFAAAPLAEFFEASLDDADVMVWPDPNGQRAGWEIEPLCRSVPFAALRDPKLYEWLVLADALRAAGRARERQIAEDILRRRLGYLGKR
ncbi:MAG: hypothetical protein K1X53_08410 [Candidatus Sumerlaeaceae bacterium]|nr:hypothetical protein [Candidatus Sumerlaeaceae bacterium]